PRLLPRPSHRRRQLLPRRFSLFFIGHRRSSLLPPSAAPRSPIGQRRAPLAPQPSRTAHAPRSPSRPLLLGGERSCVRPLLAPPPFSPLPARERRPRVRLRPGQPERGGLGVGGEAAVEARARWRRARAGGVSLLSPQSRAAAVAATASSGAVPPPPPPLPPRSPLRGTMQFMLLFSRQGKLRLQKWYVPLSDKEKKKITRELVQTVLARKPKMCSFLEWRDLKIVYKRYASLYFCCAIEDQDNELITLEIIHRYVELLDKYFGSVCELDIIFNFEKAYFILDEFLLGGEVQETSKKNVLKAIEQADLLQEPRHEYFNVPVY
uniref:AP-1 complex subunit sigma-2 n=1 Tax=Pavo cristatus TaxID=9049 RepID=A0A8C9FQB5_PAVCR